MSSNRNFRLQVRLAGKPFRLSISLIVFSFIFATSQGLSQPCRSVQVTNSEGNYIVPGVQGGIVYRQSEGKDLLLDAFVQRTGRDRPAVLVIGGSGWTSNSRVAYVGQFLELLTDAGFNWFSIEYRLAPHSPYPAALEDLRQAYHFIRCNASTFRIDPDRIAILAEDSGAHWAALLASEQLPGLQAVVLLGGIYDLSQHKLLETPEGFSLLFGESQWARAELLNQASPIPQASERVPPTLLIHGTADKETPLEQAKEYCSRLNAIDTDCRLIPVEGGIHKAENWTPAQWGYKQELVNWLTEQLDLARADVLAYPSRLKKNLIYGSYQNSAGEARPLHLDAYVPEGPGPFPAVILSHGGGWEAGDKVTYLTPVLEPLARNGFAWFSIDYRLTPSVRHPEQLEDLRRAIRYVKHYAGSFRVDPERIAILGESASGQMVVQVAARPCPGSPASTDPVEQESCQVQAVVSFYGVYDFPAMVKDASPRSLLVRLFGLRELNKEAQEILRRYSPLYQVHENMPPVLLIHGTNEILWDHGLRLAQKLKSLGVSHELVALEGAPHGMENWEGHPGWQGYKDKLVQWLKKHIGPQESVKR